MILELSTLCLRSICEGVESGRIRGHHLAVQLPPTVRQRLLDLSLIRESIGNLNSIAAFGSKEFVDGMSSLRTTTNPDGYGNWRQGQLYETWVSSLTSVSEFDAERTIGSRIERLQLILDGNKMEVISNIIANCWNLKSLELIVERPYESTVTADDRTVDDRSVRRRFGQNNSVVSKLDTLSVDCGTTAFATHFLSDVRFGNLRSLRLRGCIIDGRVWEEFMREVRPTLESLDVERIAISSSGKDRQLIPCAMDRLQHLRIGSYFSDRYFRLSTDILAQCVDLTRLDLWCLGNENFARALMQLPIADLRLNVLLFDKSHRNVLTNWRAPRFPIVDLCKDKITGFTFVAHTWNDIYNEAFTAFVAACPNLVRFRFMLRGDYVPGDYIPPVDLGSLFNNRQQCGRFEAIELSNNVKFGKLFENCIDLDHLKLNENPFVRDQDLIAWTELGGGRLLRLDLTSCPNLTHVGVIALLIASGSKLENLYFKGNYMDTVRVRRAVSQYCPYAVARYSS